MTQLLLLSGEDIFNVEIDLANKIFKIVLPNINSKDRSPVDTLVLIR